MGQSKIIRTGIKYTCTGPDMLTKWNKSANREVHKTCWQKPKFKPQASCTGCKYLEIENGD